MLGGRVLRTAMVPMRMMIIYEDEYNDDDEAE